MIRLPKPSARSIMTCLVLAAAGFGPSAATAMSTGSAGSASIDGRARGGPLDALERSWSALLASLDASTTGTPSFGPVLVLSKAPCPRSADGTSSDCGLATDHLCRGAGRTTGISFDQTTTRSCRGGLASPTGTLSILCKPSAWINHALCW
ncbi:hypothetical protein LRS73_07585 [Methylobacterium currus]|uniref:hypothetical protein n=1 Tax=Methylobacterium currus TaxID=2051553 RepID=UPI001E5149F8|nr:hypothetical protein [Methylobacterium currus]UHC17723.1 hypothetical protein LRS73_07585 [Methylobacterium currus]